MRSLVRRESIKRANAAMHWQGVRQSCDDIGERAVGPTVGFARDVCLMAHGFCTKLSSTFFRPAFSNSMVSLLPSIESMCP